GAERPRVRRHDRRRDRRDRRRRPRALAAGVARGRQGGRAGAGRRDARRAHARVQSPRGRRAARGGPRPRAHPPRGRAAGAGDVRNKRLDELPPALRERFAAGRVWAAHQAPYLASALLALDPVVVELDEDDDAVVVDLGAFPTDRRWHVYVDPEVLATTEVPELGFWLLHQVGHLLREHAKRFPERMTDDDVQPLGGRTPAQTRWNLSADVELNDDLSTDDLVLPRRGATADALGLLPDLVAEEYWDRLDPSHADTRESIKRACDCGSGCDGQERPWD